MNKDLFGFENGRAKGLLAGELGQRGISRRDFLKYCTAMAATLALPKNQISRIARALDAVERPPAIYMEFQDCAGCTEAFLRTSHPTAAEIVLDILSLNYQETIMAASGQQAEDAFKSTVEDGGYLLLVQPGQRALELRADHLGRLAGLALLDQFAEGEKSRVVRESSSLLHIMSNDHNCIKFLELSN